MAAYTGAYVIRNAKVTFAGTDFTNQVNKARLVPDTPIQTMRTLVPDGLVTDVDSTVWTLELSGVNDWETGGLSAYLNTNNGALVTVTVAPVLGTGKKIATCSVRVFPVEFGGEQGNWSTFDVTFPVQGAPVFTAQP